VCRSFQSNNNQSDISVLGWARYKTLLNEENSPSTSPPQQPLRPTSHTPHMGAAQSRPVSDPPPRDKIGKGGKSGKGKGNKSSVLLVESSSGLSPPPASPAPVRRHRTRMAEIGVGNAFSSASASSSLEEQDENNDAPLEINDRDADLYVACAPLSEEANGSQGEIVPETLAAVCRPDCVDLLRVPPLVAERRSKHKKKKKKKKKNKKQQQQQGRGMSSRGAGSAGARGVRLVAPAKSSSGVVLRSVEVAPSRKYGDAGPRVVAAGGDAGQVLLWSLYEEELLSEAGKDVPSARTLRAFPTSVSMCVERLHFAGGSTERLICANGDSRLLMIDVETGKRVSAAMLEHGGFGPPVRAIATCSGLDSGGGWVVSTACHHKIRSVDFRDKGNIVSEWYTPDRARIMDAAFSSDRVAIATCDENDLETLRVLVLDNGYVDSSCPVTAVSRCAISDDGDRVGLVTNTTVQLWRPGGGAIEPDDMDTVRMMSTNVSDFTHVVFEPTQQGLLWSINRPLSVASAS
jgi:hypothetical protein